MMPVSERGLSQPIMNENETKTGFTALMHDLRKNCRYTITFILRNPQFYAAMAEGVAAHSSVLRVKGVK